MKKMKTRKKNPMKKFKKQAKKLRCTKLVARRIVFLKMLNKRSKKWRKDMVLRDPLTGMAFLSEKKMKKYKNQQIKRFAKQRRQYAEYVQKMVDKGYISEDYMINTNQILIYESSFRTTPRFLSEFAHMISEDEPWSSMTSADILAYLNEGILAVNASAKEKELTSLDPTLLESDKELSSSLKKYQNHIHSAKILKKICEERYGLCF